MATTDDLLVQRFNEAQQELVLQSADLSLRTVASMVDGGAIDPSPQFQRRERWSPFKQSALIESFILNIPVPPVYLAEDELGTYSVIDGKQRITAIRAFLRDEFALRDLSRFSDLHGYRCSELPRQIQNALDLRPLRAITLLNQSNPAYKYEVFHRLNTGGEILNPQEIRNVIYRGPLNDLVLDLSGHDFLRHQLKILGPRSSAYKNMADAEYVLRFLTLQEDWTHFSGDFALSMNLFMERHGSDQSTRLNALSKKFERALQACKDLWGIHAFHRPEGSAWRDQTLAGMYDAQMVAVSELSDAVLRRLINPLQWPAREVVRTLFKDPTFDAAVREATNTPSRVQFRIGALKDALIAAAES